jgi:hypothetical protein
LLPLLSALLRYATKAPHDAAAAAAAVVGSIMHPEVPTGHSVSSPSNQSAPHPAVLLLLLLLVVAATHPQQQCQQVI